MTHDEAFAKLARSKFTKWIPIPPERPALHVNFLMDWIERENAVGQR